MRLGHMYPRAISRTWMTAVFAATLAFLGAVDVEQALKGDMDIESLTAALGLGLLAAFSLVLHTQKWEARAEAEAMRATESWHRNMFEKNRAIQWLLDPDTGTILDANPAACEFYGYSRAKMRGMPVASINTLPPAQLEVEMARAKAEKRSYFVFQHRLGSGEVHDVEIHSSPMELDGRVALYSVIHDISERRRAEEALEHQALHDGLTNLPNRTLLHDRLQQAILSTRRSGCPAALLLMDLDGFKEVNDTFGHHCGDLLLAQISGRLRDVLREQDTVARLGGDEFAAVLPETDAEGAILVARKLHGVIDRPFMVEGHRLGLGASVGVAVHPDHGSTTDDLLRHADVSMYVAKRTHSGCALYEPAQDEHGPTRLALITDLRHAIDDQQLLLHFQPRVSMATGNVDHAEALVRWQHPNRGLILPGAFIPVAEQTGLVEPLTLWVLGEALRECNLWQSAGLDARVAINLSARCIHDSALIESVRQMLRRHRVEPESLLLEITESAIMADPDHAMTILQPLHDIGVRVSIDDFGTGYSSLTYLKQLPVDEIKIDRSFVTDLEMNENAVIVRSVIDLGHNLGLQVVAEGVERPETWDALAGMGCDAVQGYFVSPPLQSSELLRWAQGRIARRAG